MVPDWWPDYFVDAARPPVFVGRDYPYYVLAPRIDDNIPTSISTTYAREATNPSNNDSKDVHTPPSKCLFPQPEGFWLNMQYFVGLEWMVICLIVGFILGWISRCLRGYCYCGEKRRVGDEPNGNNGVNNDDQQDQQQPEQQGNLQEDNNNNSNSNDEDSSSNSSTANGSSSSRRSSRDSSSSIDRTRGEREASLNSQPEVHTYSTTKNTEYGVYPSADIIRTSAGHDYPTFRRNVTETLPPDEVALALF